MGGSGAILSRTGPGKIVTIASTASKWERPNQAADNASNHAVVALTRCAAEAENLITPRQTSNNSR